MLGREQVSGRLVLDVASPAAVAARVVAPAALVAGPELDEGDVPVELDVEPGIRERCDPPGELILDGLEQFAVQVRPRARR